MKRLIAANPSAFKEYILGRELEAAKLAKELDIDYAIVAKRD